MFGIAFLPTLTAALVLLAIGIVWFSPQVFGTVWARAHTLDIRSLDLGTSHNIRNLIFSGVVLVVVVHILKSISALAVAASISPLKIALMLTLIMTGLFALHALTSRQSLSIFCISTVYSALVVMVGTSIVAYWPW